MPNDVSWRVKRLQQAMTDAGLAFLLCRLPENVLYVTDYWPHHGLSVAGLPVEGRPILVVPEIEAVYADRGPAEVVPFAWGLNGAPDLYDTYREQLSAWRDRFELGNGLVGVERGFEVVGPSYRSAEPVVPGHPWWQLLNSLLADVRFVDAEPIISATRAVKSDYEIAKLRVANEIAEMGLRAIAERLVPGMTEAAAGAIVEQTIRTAGPGYEGARLVRAMCEVAAGVQNSARATLLIPSTRYVIRAGDLVMVELATVVDGYWSDLTWMLVAGDPTPRQREIHNAVLAAQQAAAAELHDGAAASSPDRAAHAVLDAAGLGEHFVHITGHGVGWRYHESLPVLSNTSIDRLEAGMVTSVEPGVYIEGFGGIRIEDNVAVGERGPVFLSTPRTPW